MQNRVTHDGLSGHIRRPLWGAKLAFNGHTVFIQVEIDCYLFASHVCLLSSSLMRGAETTTAVYPARVSLFGGRQRIEAWWIRSIV